MIVAYNLYRLSVAVRSRRRDGVVDVDREVKENLYMMKMKFTSDRKLIASIISFILGVLVESSTGKRRIIYKDRR